MSFLLAAMCPFRVMASFPAKASRQAREQGPESTALTQEAQTHVPSISQATAWAALSGIGLALVIPCVQAIIAELYSPYERGRAFGFLFTVSALGVPPAASQLQCLFV